MRSAVRSHPLRALIDMTEQWLTQPEPNAAGSTGIYRILFSLFCLWNLSLQPFHAVPDWPRFLGSRAIATHTARILIPGWGLQIVEALLVAALVMLLFGLFTRASTAAVLVLGLMLDAAFGFVDLERSTVLMVFFIPFFTLAAGSTWGDTYSIDAARIRHAGFPTVSPTNNHWRYSIAARATLAVLVFLFVSAAAMKMLGTWRGNGNFVAFTMLKQSIWGTANGYWPNPMGPVVFEIPFLALALQASVVILEASFVFALVSRKLRNLVFVAALLFHAYNEVMVFVTFTPILVAYMYFVDWHGVRVRLFPARFPLANLVSAKTLTVGVVMFAIVAGACWRILASGHRLMNLNGLLTAQTIWFAVVGVVGLSLIVMLADTIQSRRLVSISTQS